MPSSNWLSHVDLDNELDVFFDNLLIKAALNSFADKHSENIGEIFGWDGFAVLGDLDLDSDEV